MQNNNGKNETIHKKQLNNYSYKGSRFLSRKINGKGNAFLMILNFQPNDLGPQLTFIRIKFNYFHFSIEIFSNLFFIIQ